MPRIFEYGKRVGKRNTMLLSVHPILVRIPLEHVYYMHMCMYVTSPRLLPYGRSGEGIVRRSSTCR